MLFYYSILAMFLFFKHKLSTKGNKQFHKMGQDFLDNLKINKIISNYEQISNLVFTICASILDPPKNYLPKAILAGNSDGT